MKWIKGNAFGFLKMLTQIIQRFRGKIIDLWVDNAPWHRGKLVDFLSEEADVVVRFQGGANAGHTVHIKNKKYILHLIPGGILRPNVQCVIGNGVVFDPHAFFEEIDFLKENDISIENRLFLSDRAHVIFPYHKIIDRYREHKLNEQKIGTTGRGIGPCYVDKFNRCGIRVIDLFDDDALYQKLNENIAEKNKIIENEYHQKPLVFKEVYDQTKNYAEKLKSFVTDTSSWLYDAWNSGKNILLEGAQGSLLDVDFGSYPYVTSSNPSCGGAI